MTANAFSEDVQNCLNAGMDAHISKPLDIGVLERTLKSVAGGKAAGGGQVVHR
jgi:CheY-like chemotaxis protein